MRLFGFHEGLPGSTDPAVTRTYASRTADAIALAGGIGVDFRTGLGAAASIAQRNEVCVLASGGPLFIGAGPSRQRFATGIAHAILEAYLARGDTCVDTLSGRFAFAVVDAARARVLLAVDPMGIERLTYALSGSTVVFGSSAESVARFPGFPLRIDHQSLFDYLVLHMVPAPGTIFEDVKKLRPGHCVVLEKGQARERRYWSARFADAGPADYESLKSELHRSLRTSVSDCAPTATTGAFLSGGLDSSTVAGVLSEVGPPPARTFSIGFGYPEYDELSYARIANARFHCQGHEYVVTGDDIADGFAKIARAYDEPFGNSSALPVYHCARFARENGIDHLLAGDGGDELFAGNSRYAEQEVYERYQRVPRLLRTGLLEPAVRAWPRQMSPWLVRKARGYIEKANIPLPARLETWNFLLRQGTAEILHPDFRSVASEQETFRKMQALWDSAPANNALDRMLYYDWQYTLADNDLRKVETMSELAGVRVSYPMLHPDVVDLSMRVPPDLMMPGTRLRDFYKRATTGFLPDEIIHKKKHGFGLPFGLWLQETPRLRAQIDGNLAALRSRRIIAPQFIDRLLDLHGQQDAKYYGVFIWVLAMLEQWLTEHDLAP
jgi:asparagine synthase (glutamine-hydrolysing)